MTKAQLIDILRQRVKQAGSQRKFAANLGVSEVFLSDVLHGNRNPGPKLLNALALRSEVVYYPLKTDEESTR